MTEPELTDEELVDRVIYLLCELKIRHKMELLYQRIEELRLWSTGTEIVKNILGE